MKFFDALFEGLETSLTEKKKSRKKPYSSITYTTGDPQLNIDHFNKMLTGKEDNTHTSGYLNGTFKNDAAEKACAKVGTFAAASPDGGNTVSLGGGESASGEGGGMGESLELEEAKRYVRRYYIRPQHIWCSNKAEILKALIDHQDENCSIYTLNNLKDNDDVTKLSPKDIIYYYDDGILYDKNHVRVMDYDLKIKHEEERDNIDPDKAPESTFKNVYDDRMTDQTVVESVEMKEMMINKYPHYIEKIKADFPALVKETQGKLNSSDSKSTDFAILSVFYSKLFGQVEKNWDMNELSEVFSDSESMNPMPESVGKQLCSQLFKIKNINLLFDLDVYEGLALIQEFIDNPSKADYANFYNDCVQYGKDTFNESIEAPENEFDLDFESHNAYGNRIVEGKEFGGECCICGEEIEGFGNNAEPVKSGRCCDSCNLKFVIPARLEQAQAEEQ